jgi:hypothetical protein
MALIRRFLAVFLAAFLVFSGWRAVGGERRSPSAPRARLEVDKFEFAQYSARPFPDAWARQISQDLEPFQSTNISKALIDATASTFPRALRLLIVNNTLRSYPEQNGRPHAILILLMRLLCMHKVPDVEFLVNAADLPLISSTQSPVPMFSWVKTVAHWDVLMPYWSFAWVPWQPQELPVLNASMWQAKEGKAFWRGSATGAIYTSQNWRNMTRTKLVALCNARGELCDGGMTRCRQCSEDAKASMQEAIGFVEGTPPDEFEKYKYAILVDGNSSPSSRSRRFFSGSSLVMWQETPYFEFFYSSLRPYRHYVPLARDVGDLYQQIEWAQAHDVEAQNMVRNSQRLAAEFFTADAINAYMHELLLQYSRVMRYVPSRHNTTTLPVWLDVHAQRYFQHYMRDTCPNGHNFTGAAV